MYIQTFNKLTASLLFIFRFILIAFYNQNVCSRSIYTCKLFYQFCIYKSKITTSIILWSLKRFEVKFARINSYTIIKKRKTFKKPYVKFSSCFEHPKFFYWHFKKSNQKNRKIKWSSNNTKKIKIFLKVYWPYKYCRLYVNRKSVRLINLINKPITKTIIIQNLHSGFLHFLLIFFYYYY